MATVKEFTDWMEEHADELLEKEWQRHLEWMRKQRNLMLTGKWEDPEEEK